MKFLHSMIRTNDLEATKNFYINLLGLKLIRYKDYEQGRFSLYFFATDIGEPEIEVTHNWEDREYTSGNNFGHLAFMVDDIYATCEKLENGGVAILRPPRDGYMAFIKDPQGISIELLQQGERRPPHTKWVNMQNVGTW